MYRNSNLTDQTTGHSTECSHSTRDPEFNGYGGYFRSHYQGLDHPYPNCDFLINRNSPVPGKPYNEIPDLHRFYPEMTGARDVDVERFASIFPHAAVRDTHQVWAADPSFQWFKDIERNCAIFDAPSPNSQTVPFDIEKIKLSLLNQFDPETAAKIMRTLISEAPVSPPQPKPKPTYRQAEIPNSGVIRCSFELDREQIPSDSCHSFKHQPINPHRFQTAANIMHRPKQFFGGSLYNPDTQESRITGSELHFNPVESPHLSQRSPLRCASSQTIGVVPETIDKQIMTRTVSESGIQTSNWLTEEILHTDLTEEMLHNECDLDFHIKDSTTSLESNIDSSSVKSSLEDDLNECVIASNFGLRSTRESDCYDDNDDSSADYFTGAVESELPPMFRSNSISSNNIVSVKSSRRFNPCVLAVHPDK